MANDELHLPWEPAALETLLRKVLTLGETTKVDLKSAFDTSDVQHQGEFLKDIAAIANTYSPDYLNHGFLVFGTDQGQIVGCAFPNSIDHIQASIDDLVKKHLAPFIRTHLYFFTDGETQWGVLVVPPTRNAPHVFIADSHKRARGDVYVRSGTTTAKAQPEDY